MQTPCRFEGVYLDAVNYSMQQNHVPVIRKLILHNPTEQSYESITVTISAEPVFAETYSVVISSLIENNSVEADPISLRILPDFLLSLTERMTGCLKITAVCQDEVIAESEQDVVLLPYDYWVGLSVMPEMLAAFITPNRPEIPLILSRAGALLETWGGDPSFTAYQSQDPNIVRRQMAAIYASIQQENIMYIQAPASFEPIGQRIRLLDRLLVEKMGNCLDLTLLYCACLEAVGLHGLLICKHGHIFAGCWLESESFPECIQDDLSLIEKLIAEGIHEIELVECTAATAGKQTDFDAASAAARRQLDDETFEMVIDVKRARGGGIRPIPLRRIAEDGSVAIEPEPVLRDAISGLTYAPKAVDVYDKLTVVESVEMPRQKIWERKLLDLNMHNPLLNFRVTKASLQLLINDLGQLEDAVSAGQEFQILDRPKDFSATLRDAKIYELETGADMVGDLLKNEFENHRLRTMADEGELAGRVVHLYRQARSSIEENGANTLFLALGFLRWYETDLSQKARYAPVVLLPVEIVRKSALKGYVIRARDEEPMINITLLEMLRQDFGVSLGGLDPLPMDEHGVDLGRIFSVIRQAVMDRPRWDVEKLAFLGLFGFSHFIMWNDLRNRSGELRQNKVVSSLLSGKLEWIPQSDFPSMEALDTLSPEDLALPSSTDSSQLTAVCAAGQGHSFVLHGPPGTGKSQTITNIIANMLYQGKTVLFIAEKMAALSVVQRRLEAVGLAPFCMELHSNKARKKDVLNQLEQTLELGRIKPPEAYREEADKLLAMRRSLNGVTAAIHKTRPCGMSLYETISAYERTIEAPDGLTVPASLLKTADAAHRSEWLDCLQKLAAASKECGDIPRHPFKDFRNHTYTPTLRDTLRQQWVRYRDTLEKLEEAVCKLSPLLGLTKDKSRTQTEALVELCKLLVDETDIPPALYSHAELFALSARVSEVCEAGRTRDTIRANLLADFTESVLSYDEDAARIAWNTAENQWFLLKMLGKGKIRKQLKAMCKNPSAIASQAIPALLDTISAYQKNACIVTDSSGMFDTVFGLLWNSGHADFDRIEATYTKAAAIRRTFGGLSDDPAERVKTMNAVAQQVVPSGADFRQRHESLLTETLSLWEQLGLLEADLSTLMRCDFATFGDVPAWNTLMVDKARSWLASTDMLRDWGVFLSVAHTAAGLGLAPAVRALEEGTLVCETLIPSFEKALYLGLSQNMIGEDETLRRFSGTLIQTDIDAFKSQCERFEHLTRQELAARLSARIPSGGDSVSASSEIGMLKRAIKSGGRAQSIRKLFDSIPHLLPKLFPCMLMSPISVAQYIDPSYPPFDLVIFDEASQLPTCEAVGAIARGKELIVVGDPKQLPPTSFFSVNRVDDDNFEHEDMESILDDCLALSMPETYLRWHYRSRHESLIAFSNRHYYGNGLYTFPSPADLVSEVRHVPVEGVYDRGKTKQNRAEADAVVAEIALRFSDETLRRQSIGVVTFSAVQQNLIEDQLQTLFAKHPDWDEWNNACTEPVFVKNLENVQGDERDVILFSVGYGPDETGKVTLNFGPLNRDGGWRRLNVAVSRARYQMIVFSTLRPEQIDLSKTGAEGVAGLRAFLEYAQYGVRALPERADTGRPATDFMIQNAARQIQALGYQTQLHVGASQYKVDVGILHPERDGQYALGILFDGENHKNSLVARDRHLLQTSVLRSLGWNIYTVWSLDWLESRQKTLQKIEAAIKAALRASPEQAAQTMERTVISPQSFERMEEAVLPSGGETYCSCTLPPAAYAQEDFYLPKANSVIRQQILFVVETEAPVSKTRVYRKVAAAWGMSRVGNRIQQKLDEQLKVIRLPITRTLDTEFLWRSEVYDQYDTFRTPASENERRDVTDIPKEELACAIKDILRRQISLPLDDIVREVCRVFGFARVGDSAAAWIGEGIAHAVQNGDCVIEHERIVMR